jgi:hypothetical protein
LTPEQAAIAQTVQTPGWAIIKKQAEARIRLTKEAALHCQTDEEVLAKYRLAWAAQSVLSEFLWEIEDEEPLSDSGGSEFSTKEAEF